MSKFEIDDNVAEVFVVVTVVLAAIAGAYLGSL